jgi:hypothetical protein
VVRQPRKKLNKTLKVAIDFQTQPATIAGKQRTVGHLAPTVGSKAAKNDVRNERCFLIGLDQMAYSEVGNE